MTDITSDHGFSAAFLEARPVLMSVACGIVGRERAEDVISETALRAWKFRHSFRGDEASPRTWFYRITRNVALDVIRRERRRIAFVDADLEAIARVMPDRRPSPEQDLVFAASERSFVDAIESRFTPEAAPRIMRWVNSETESIEAVHRTSSWRYRHAVQCLATTYFTQHA